MIETNQVLVLGILILLWGMASLVRPQLDDKTFCGLLISVLGAALLLGGVASFLKPLPNLGEFLFGLGMAVLAGLAAVLISALPDLAKLESHPEVSDQKPENVDLKNFGQVPGFLESMVQRAEDATLGQQILLLFFFLTSMLLVRLT